MILPHDKYIGINRYNTITLAYLKASTICDLANVYPYEEVA